MDDIDKPWSSEFEIDADASWYFGFPPMDVKFAAKPLNGSPPFTYTWTFDDGSPGATGQEVDHRYTKIGQYHPAVVGKDGNGETYRVEFVIAVVTIEHYADIKKIDIEELRRFISPSPIVTP